jgi:hypothetical protein
LETPCPEDKERIMEFPFGCGLEDCPRVETSLRFEDRRKVGDRM